MTSKHNTSKTTNPAWLSGDRLEQYQKVRKQDYVSAGVIALAFIFTVFMPAGIKLHLSRLLLVLAFWLLIVRIVRGETYFQFRLKELKHTKQQSQTAVKVLLDAKDSTKRSR